MPVTEESTTFETFEYHLLSEVFRTHGQLRAEFRTFTHLVLNSHLDSVQYTAIVDGIVTYVGRLKQLERWRKLVVHRNYSQLQIRDLITRLRLHEQKVVDQFLQTARDLRLSHDQLRYTAALLAHPGARSEALRQYHQLLLNKSVNAEQFDCLDEVFKHVIPADHADHMFRAYAVYCILERFKDVGDILEYERPSGSLNAKVVCLLDWPPIPRYASKKFGALLDDVSNESIKLLREIMPNSRGYFFCDLFPQRRDYPEGTKRGSEAVYGKEPLLGLSFQLVAHYILNLKYERTSRGNPAIVLFGEQAWAFWDQVIGARNRNTFTLNGTEYAVYKLHHPCAMRTSISREALTLNIELLKQLGEHIEERINVKHLEELKLSRQSASNPSFQRYKFATKVDSNAIADASTKQERGIPKHRAIARAAIKALREMSEAQAHQLPENRSVQSKKTKTKPRHPKALDQDVARVARKSKPIKLSELVAGPKPKRKKSARQREQSVRPGVQKPDQSSELQQATPPPTPEAQRQITSRRHIPDSSQDLEHVEHESHGTKPSSVLIPGTERTHDTIVAGVGGGMDVLRTPEPLEARQPSHLESAGFQGHFQEANLSDRDVHSGRSKRAVEAALDEESGSDLHGVQHKRPRLSSEIPAPASTFAGVLNQDGELLETSRQVESAVGEESHIMFDDTIDCIKQPQDTRSMVEITAQHDLALSIHDRLWPLQEVPRVRKPRILSEKLFHQAELFTLRKSDVIDEIYAFLTREQKGDCNHLITEQVCAAVMLMDGKDPQGEPALKPLPYCTVPLLRMVDVRYVTHQAVKLRKLLPERVSIYEYVELGLEVTFSEILYTALSRHLYDDHPLEDGSPDSFPDSFLGAIDMLLHLARDWILDNPDAKEIALRLDRKWRCDTGLEGDDLVTFDEPAKYYQHLLDGMMETMTNAELEEIIDDNKPEVDSDGTEPSDDDVRMTYTDDDSETDTQSIYEDD